MNSAADLKDEVMDLTWTLLDEEATDSQVRRLEKLLLASGEAREMYARCLQMHVDLHYLIGGKQARLPLTNIFLPRPLTGEDVSPGSSARLELV